MRLPQGVEGIRLDGGVRRGIPLDGIPRWIRHGIRLITILLLIILAAVLLLLALVLLGLLALLRLGKRKAGECCTPTQRSSFY